MGYKPDWRLFDAVRAKSKPGGLFAKEEDVFLKAILPPFDYDNKKISFGLPYACALFLGYAFKLYKNAMDLKRQSFCKIKNDRIPDDLAFAYFEKIIASVFFAYNALEAYANLEIPDDHLYYKERKKIFLAESKTTIERLESTEIKLGEILPKALKIDSPKGKVEWQDYLKLKEIRDRIVHLKTIDQAVINDDPNSIWKILFSKNVPNYPEITKNLISYFYKTNISKKPSWLVNCPY